MIISKSEYLYYLDCRTVLEKEIELGSATTFTRKRKRFMYNPLFNLYLIYVDNEVIETNNDIHTLLDSYNTL